MTNIWRPREARAEGTPRHEWISKAIANDIAAGRLRAGELLPPQRELADALGVALGTVTRAYASARRRGLVFGQRRRGTVVASEGPVDNPLASLMKTPPSRIDLAANLPLYAADPDPSLALREIAGHPDARQLLRYPPPEGLPRHRGAAAQWLQEQGLPVRSEDVMVVGGAQHGIFVALAATTQPGDTVLVEALTYPGVLAAARMLGLNVRGVAIDGDGLVPEALDAALTETDARVLYCIPTVQNPTTATLPASRRQAVVQIIERHHVVLIEDAIHRALVTEPETSLYARAPERTILVSGASKVVAGGLRVGFVAAAPSFHPELRSAIQASSFAISPLTAEVFATWLEDGTLARTVREKRRQAARRIRLVHDELGDIPGIEVRADPQSYIVWLVLGAGRSASQLAEEALARGVRVLAARHFRPDPGGEDHALRLCVGSAEDLPQLRSALRELRRLLTDVPVAEPIF